MISIHVLTARYAQILKSSESNIQEDMTMTLDQQFWANL
jgi:hypothetical protein